MPLSLGEKLRQAREERGISISEIAEQTRISPHYLKSIENNDFKILPGGIFNKGFVKSFARYVGVDEAEAVQDYVLALGEPEYGSPEEPKAYHPQVLTDDRASSSMAPTILFAVIILALMTGGILFVVRYLLSPTPPPAAATSPQPGQSPPANSIGPGTNTETTVSTGDKISVDLKAVTEPVWISYSIDGVPKVQTLAPNETLRLDASDALKISYSKAKLPNLQVTVNGRPINIPPPQKGTVELDINRSNVNELIQGGQAAPPSTETPAASPAANATEPRRSPEPEKSKTPKPSPSNATTSTPKPKPTPSGTVIVVGPERPKPAPSKTPN